MSAPERRRFVKASGRLNKAARKQQLLAHAKQLFVAHGYQNTTMGKIVRAAGVTEPLLYRHFDSKKALFLEVLKEVRGATLGGWDAETADLTDNGASHPQHPSFGNYATLRYGIAVEEMREQWCRWMATTLAAGSPH